MNEKEAAGKKCQKKTIVLLPFSCLHLIDYVILCF